MALSFQNCFNFGSSSYQIKVLRILGRGGRIWPYLKKIGFETAVPEGLRKSALLNLQFIVCYDFSLEY